MSELEGLLGELSGQGRSDSRGVFTLKLERALELLARHRTREPESYVLHVVAAAVAGGARWIDVRVLNGRTVFVYEGHLLTAAERDWFLQSPLLPEAPVHLQELALAMLGAGALPGAEVVLRSQAGVQFRRGRVEPGPSAARNELEVRTRRSWWWHSRARGPELAYLERFCRHCSVPLTVNGEPLAFTAEPAVACLELGPEGARDLPPSLEAGYRNWREFPWRGWIALGVDLGFPAPLCLRRHGVLVPVERELPIPCQVLIEADLPCDLEGKPVEGPELARLLEELRPNLAMLAFEVIWQELGSLQLRQQLLRGLMRLAPGRVDELRVLRLADAAPVTLRELEQAFEERGYLCVVADEGDYPRCWGPVVLGTPLLGPVLAERFANLVPVDHLRDRVEDVPRLFGEFLLRMPLWEIPGELGLTLMPRECATAVAPPSSTPGGAARSAYRALTLGGHARRQAVSDHALLHLSESRHHPVPEEFARLVWGWWPHDAIPKSMLPETRPTDPWVAERLARVFALGVGCTARTLKVLQGRWPGGPRSTWDVLESLCEQPHLSGGGLPWLGLQKLRPPRSREPDWAALRQEILDRAALEAWRYKLGPFTTDCLLLALLATGCGAQQALAANGVTTAGVRRLLAQRKPLEAAVEVSDRTLARPGAPTFVMLGTFRAWHGDLAGANEDCAAALADNPRCYWARLLQGQVALSRGFHDEAREAFEGAAARRLDGPEAQHGLGWCDYLDG